MSDLAFTPEFDSAKCSDGSITGPYSTKFDYIVKHSTGEGSYGRSAQVGDFSITPCQPYLHYNVNVGNLKIDKNIETVVNINSTGNITYANNVTASTFTGNLTGNVNGVASGNKLFDIPHVKQKGKRIRHVIAEGPEAGIYVRGQLKNKNVIELPEYWDGLIDPETITVTMTQIGYSQDLIVDKIEWGKRILVRSGNGANIHCFYEVWAARWLDPMDHDKTLHVVYDGETPDDYPGGNENFLIGGWDYDRRETKWRSDK